MKPGERGQVTTLARSIGRDEITQANGLVALRPACIEGFRAGDTVKIGEGDNIEESTVGTVYGDVLTVRISHPRDRGEQIEVIHPFTPCAITTGFDYDSRGTVTVGCPKIWRSERVFSVLDGILRDVDSITLKALQGLDSNVSNASVLISLLNDLQINAKFDQADLANNQLKKQKIDAVRGSEIDNLKRQQETNKTALQRRDLLLQESVELQKQELELVKAGKTDPDTSPELKAVQAQETTVKNQISAIDTQLATPATISDQSLSSTTVDKASPGTKLNPISDDLKKAAFKDFFQKPSLPASMQMDNVIELLHQRLSREFSVMYDDLSRLTDQYDLYLLQFDIGIIPRHDSKDQAVKVEFSFNDGVQAYELYPGMSSYNIMRGMDKTSRFGISGIVQTLFGFGLSAAFNHERNELRSGLSQSLYVSGFGTGSHDFGWLIGPAPFENFVNPGNRIVHALILVPHGAPRSNLALNVSYCWVNKEQRYQWLWSDHSDYCRPGFPMNVNLPREPSLAVEKVLYDPLELKEVPGSGPAPAQPDTASIQIVFREPIDPNLVITAGSRIINRVRDVRGRAMFGATAETLAGNRAEQDAIAGSRFGFLEKDALGKDTWLQTSAKTILLNIGKDTAGTDVFPNITFSNPGMQGGELSSVLSPAAQIRIGEFEFTGQKLPPSAFLPLFSKSYDPGPFKVYVEKTTEDNPALPSRLQIVSETYRSGRSKPVWLHDHAQVVLEIRNRKRTAFFALDCAQRSGSLSCNVPLTAIKTEFNKLPATWKVWLDQPPYYNRPGLWGDDDISQHPAEKEWRAQAFAAGGWHDIRELKCNQPKQCDQGSNPNSWQATIKLRNTDQLRDPGNPAAVPAPDSLCIRESKDIADSMKKQANDLSKRLQSTLSIFQFSGLAADNETVKKGREQTVTYKADMAKTELREIQVESNATGDSITLTVPFIALPIITQRLHLQRRNAKEKNCSLEDPDNFLLLPDLARSLLPSVVKVTELKNGSYRLEGDRLRAVDQVRLEGNGRAIVSSGSAGLNSVDFYPRLDGKDLKPGTYVVYAVIRNTTIPLSQEGADGKLSPATIVVPKPPETKPDKPTADSNVKVNIDLKLKTDAQASTKTKPAAGTGGQSTDTSKKKGTSNGASQSNNAQKQEDTKKK